MLTSYSPLFNFELYVSFNIQEKGRIISRKGQERPLDSNANGGFQWVVLVVLKRGGMFKCFVVDLGNHGPEVSTQIRGGNLNLMEWAFIFEEPSEILGVEHLPVLPWTPWYP